MGGWLGEFAELGLIEWQAAQTAPITLLRAPTESELEKRIVLMHRLFRGGFTDMWRASLVQK
ncbi:hypothetical protein PKHYL_00240 [Psychrobacter sp. KH172YL61]|nr:hypothetical protein PKHYL_00240 [Psychrobacter sp. KH172YL61]